MKVLVLFDLPRSVPPEETFTMKELREQEDRATEADVMGSLRKLGHEVDALAVFDSAYSVVDRIRDTAPDIVFNLCESFFNERCHEPNIPALLELLRVPYTGAGPDALLLCKDKELAKTILVYHHIRVPRFVVSRKRRPRRTLRHFTFPAFVKPLGEESSDGIVKASFARNEKEAIERSRFIHDRLGCDAMIEEYVEGREIYVSVLGNRNRSVTVLPPRELFFGDLPENEPRFATFRTKWDESYRAKWNIQNGPAAPLPEGIDRKLSERARSIYDLLKIQGLARMDFRLSHDGELVFLEANPNPSLAKIEDFAQSAAAAGLDYEALVERVLSLGRLRWT
jgi:D-alanine-D-alanine ligase